MTLALIQFTETTKAQEDVDLELTMEVENQSSITAQEGETLDFEVRVENRGPDDAQDVEIRAEFGEDFADSVFSISPSSDCDEVGDEIVCEIAELRDNEDFTLRYSIRIEDNVNEGERRLDARVSTDSDDDFTSNNSDEVIIDLEDDNGDGDLELTMEVNNDDDINADAGDLLNYEVTVRNEGNSDATDLTLRSEFDDNRIDNISSISPSSDCDELGDEIVCTISRLRDGETFTLRYNARLENDAAEGIMRTSSRIIDNGITRDTDQVTVDVDDDDPFDDDDDDDEIDYDLIIRKDVQDLNGNWQTANSASSAARVSSNDQINVRYRIIVTNQSDVSLFDLEIEDDFSSSDYDLESIYNVSGADWDSGDDTFTLDEVRVNDSEIIYYTARLDSRSGGRNDANNRIRATEGRARINNNLRTINFFESDNAYIESAGSVIDDDDDDDFTDFGQLTLTSNANRSSLEAGEMVEFYLTVRNNDNVTLDNLRLEADIAPQLEFVSNDQDHIFLGNNTFEWRRDNLSAGRTWNITLRMRAKTDAGIGTINNLFAAKASNANNDLGNVLLTLRAAPSVTPSPSPGLPTTGAKDLVVSLMAISIAGAGYFYFLRRRVV
jgi:hypothetical protein